MALLWHGIRIGLLGFIGKKIYDFDVSPEESSLSTALNAYVNASR